MYFHIWHFHNKVQNLFRFLIGAVYKRFITLSIGIFLVIVIFFLFTSWHRNPHLFFWNFLKYKMSSFLLAIFKFLSKRSVELFIKLSFLNCSLSFSITIVELVKSTKLSFLNWILCFSISGQSCRFTNVTIIANKKLRSIMLFLPLLLVSN